MDPLIWERTKMSIYYLFFEKETFYFFMINIYVIFIFI